ncbi:DUF6090 family protein [uncultured Eudoraea sp.]|uniref:DUF6090 family protein n=1 Tax=uncultured Eudoraea sp. TaxID=1035614 RepID=UPI00260B962A|nr:DUF6090 family protein [uncultured Eudoraea sp.]
MINFFSRIRKRLADDNPPGWPAGKALNYMKYAIGEILLVVLGILIALQINNWNENQKTKAQIKNSLIALKSDLAQDTLLIKERLPFIVEQYQLNESLRARVAKPGATIDTLIEIMRHEFNPNWSVQIIYNTNTYNSLNQTGLIELISDSLRTKIKNFYNKKFSLKDRIEKTTNDYQEKITSYVNTYTFGSTSIHDQGPLIDSLVWEKIDNSHLAATFQGISNFKRILFTETKEELEFSLSKSRSLMARIDEYINNSK